MARKAYDERNRITTGDGRWFRISILWLSQMPIRASQELSWLSAMSGRGSIGQPHEFVIHERSAPAFTASRVVHREPDRARDPAHDLSALAAVRRQLSCTARRNGVLVCIARP